MYIDTLTDEELAVLGGESALAVRPYLDELPPAEQELAKRVAYRSLLARGVVEPPTADAVEAARSRIGAGLGSVGAGSIGAGSIGAGSIGVGQVDVLVREDIHSPVQLRRGSPLVVALARTTGGGHDFQYAYLADDVVLVEQVTEAGLHRFSLLAENQLLDLVVDGAVHPDSGDCFGEPVEMPAEPDPDQVPAAPILDELGRALLRADLVVRFAGEVAPNTVSVFSGPHGSWLVSHRDGEPSLARPMRADEIREHVRWMVTDSRREMAELHG